jgi:Mg2+ and Co2+ transporter CorA
MDGTAVEVRVVTSAGVQARTPDELPALLRGPDLVWVDVPSWDEAAAAALVEPLGLHAGAVRECAERNPLPKVHIYPDHVFVVLHAPEAGPNGHVHYIELDQFIGPNWLVTVHGPLGTDVDPVAAETEARAVLRRLESGRLRAGTAPALSHALVTALTGRLRDFLAALTHEVWRLEQTVMAGHMGDAETFLEELFRVRHGLLAGRTMAALAREVYGRMSTQVVFGKHQGELLRDTEDQFRRISAMADTQREYLQGVIEFYQTRTNTKMTIAAERLAVIAALTLPVTAISSVVGMNVIVNTETHWGWLLVLLAGMLVMSVALLIWARRQGWW